MKATTFSCVLFLLALLFSGSMSLAQETSRDSLDYYNSIANAPKKEQDLQKAYRYFLEYYDSAKKTTDTLALVFGLQRLSTLEYKVGLYAESENSAVEALNILDHYKSSPYVKTLKISLYNHLGLVYQERQFYSKAEDLYETSLALTQSASDSLILYNNLGHSLIKQAKYQAAEPYLLSAQELIPKVNDSMQIARIWANLGYVKHKLGKEGSLSLLLKGLHTRKQASDLAGTYHNYKLLASFYEDWEQSTIVKHYLDSAYNMAKQLKSLSFQQDILKAKALSNPSDVNTYFVVADSLKKLTNENQNTFALIKYDFDTLNQNMLENQLLAQKAKNKSILLGVSLVFLVLISLGLMFWLQIRNKKKRLLEVYETESRISKKVHDEVANDVYHVMAKLQQEPNSNNDILDSLESIYTKTREISQDNSVIYTSDFQTTLRDLVMNFQTEQVNIILKGLSGIQWEDHAEIEKTTIYKVLQELMVNMRKHSQASQVGLTFEQKGHKLHIVYSDNGRGSQLKKQLGLQTIEKRIHAIGGSITFYTEPQKGFKAKLIL